MPLETNLNQSPYFDDYDEKKQFAKILFRPTAAVQTRELNQLQTILQKQIERFGDNILKRGTIVDGCNFHYYSTYPYIKINDFQKDGIAAIPSRFVTYFAKSANSQIGLNAYIINHQDGFESTDPDMKTLYINYINAGANNSTSSFAAGDIVTIYDPSYPLFSVKVNNGGIGFSNSDSVVVSSSILVNVAAGTFSNGEYVYQPYTGANVQIIGIDSSTYSSSNQVVLQLKPRSSDLSNASVNSAAWVIANSNPIRNASNTVTASVEGIIGGGSAGIIVTDATGKVTTVTLTDRGSQYNSLPFVTIKSSNNNVGLSTLQLTPQNYIANVQISANPNSTGNGYAFGVSEGIVYQKGYFSFVESQTIIVDKYSPMPDGIVVGFDTLEQIVNFNQDASLLGNAFTSNNVNAPGADRLKLVPQLTLKTKEEAASNASFFTLTEWSEGLPFKQNQSTTYNKINDEMAKRTFDDSGNFVLDPFQVTTRSPLLANQEGQTFDVIVDPGTAYIEGYRVSTAFNYSATQSTGYDVGNTANHVVSLDYGNFIRIKEVAGTFQFNTGDNVDLYDTSAQYLSNTALAVSGTISAVGTKIGTARMFSMIYYDGVPGTNTATYKMYIFNVMMNTGKNFRDVKSVFYNGTNKGIADLILQPNLTLGKNVATIESTSNNGLLFPSGVESLKSSSNNTYSYRTIDQTSTIANTTGRIVKDISGVIGEYFPYGSSLTPAEMATIYVVPTSNNLTSYYPLTGNVSVNTTSNSVLGVGTNFINEVQSGDYIKINDGTSSFYTKISSVVNNTFLTAASNGTFANATGTKLYNFYPKNIPIQLNTRVGGQASHSANVNSNGNILTVQLKYANGSAMALASTTTIAGTLALGVNISRINVVPSTNSPNRNAFIKISTSNNVAKFNGPWCLGVPDAFRLRGVYIGNSTVSNTGPNFADDFYIDHNQTENYYDLSYLFIKPSVATTINSGDYILAQFDYGTLDQVGFLNTTSYLHETDAATIAINDSTPLSNLTTTYHSLEIPEVFTSQGVYYDLMNTFDFRPRVTATVTPSLTYGSAPLNPAYSLSFGNTADPTNDKKIPIPGTSFNASLSYFMGRIDSVFIDRDQNINVKSGKPSQTIATAKEPTTPRTSMRIDNMVVPPYPSIPFAVSDQLRDIIKTRVGNENLSNSRINNHLIRNGLSSAQTSINQPRGYTKNDIGQLDRRISALEYYTSLSLLETDMKDKIIPSSNDPTLARFKYGFFVDDFSTLNLSETSNPQYSANVENDKLIPRAQALDNHLASNTSCNFIDFVIASQDTATKGANNVTCQPSTTVANNWILKQQKTQISTIKGQEEKDVVSVTMSSVAGPAALYAYFYSGADRIEIYQGNTLFLSSNNAQALTSADKTRMLSNAVPSGWFNTQEQGVKEIDLNHAFTIQPDSRGDAVNYAFKFAWTHNPTKGLVYTIKTTKFTTIWRYGLEYPVNGNSVSCPAPVTPTTTVYTGAVVIKTQTDNKSSGSLSYSGAPAGSVGSYNDPSDGKVVVSGSGPQYSSSGSSSASSRVICTHFFKKGLLDKELWRADLEYTFKNLSAQTVRGYQYWAVPYVKLMRNYNLAEKIMLPFAKSRAEELAYQLGKLDKGNLLGKLVRLVGEPLCYIIGGFVGEQDWESLWKETSVKNDHKYT